MDRRNFFQLAAGSALVAFQNNAVERAAAATRSISDKSPQEVASDEDYWGEIRNAFSIDRNIINLNNGYVSPAPRVVQDALRRYLEYSDMGPVHTMINVLERQVETVRRRIAETAGCDPEEIAITRNASESLENAQYGIDLKAGDEVLTTNQDYPRMLTTFRQRERREGIVLKTISFPVPPPSMDDLYQRFENAVTPKTKLILVVPHHQPHRTNFSREAHLPDGARSRYPGDRGWCARFQSFSVQDLGPGLRLLRHQPAQMDVRSHRHRIFVRPQITHSEYLVDDGVVGHAGGRHPQVRGDRNASGGQSQRHQRRIDLQREYRHPPQGCAAALSSRSLGQPAGAESKVQDPAQPGSGAILWDRFPELQRSGRGENVRCFME
jgi:hypothetical protein